jgi:hypothetical protein
MKPPRVVALVVVVVLSGCGSAPPVAPRADTGTAVAAPSGSPTGTTCDGARGKVEQLYRAAARDKEPARVTELVADNTAMVMHDCATAPDRIAACVAAAATASELETRCLVPLDDEGTEGEKRSR